MTLLAICRDWSKQDSEAKDCPIRTPKECKRSVPKVFHHCQWKEHQRYKEDSVTHVLSAACRCSWPDHLGTHVLILLGMWVWDCEWMKSEIKCMQVGKINLLGDPINKYCLHHAWDFTFTFVTLFSYIQHGLTASRNFRMLFTLPFLSEGQNQKWSS